MPNLISNLIKKYNIGVFPIYEKWSDIGTPKSLKMKEDNILIVLPVRGGSKSIRKKYL